MGHTLRKTTETQKYNSLVFKRESSTGKKVQNVLFTDMQFRTATMYHLAPVKMAMIKSLQTITTTEGLRKRDPPKVRLNVSGKSH